MTGNVHGRGKVSRVVHRFNVMRRRAVTFNSKNGSVDVLHRTTVKMTVNGTGSSIGRATSCVAASMSRSKVRGTLGRFKVV